jgi:hypothetical protein
MRTGDVGGEGGMRAAAGRRGPERRARPRRARAAWRRRTLVRSRILPVFSSLTLSRVANIMAGLPFFDACSGGGGSVVRATSG